MSPYTFKGDLNLVSQRQLDYIGEILQNKNIKGPDVLVEPVGQVGDNYVANVKRITVDNDGDSFKIVAKFAPIQEKLRNMMKTELMFRNEHVFYTEILPKFKQLQLKAGLSTEEMFRHPVCYGSLSEAPDEVIVLEDLRESGFQNLSRFKPLSTECVKLTLKNLAIFHSLSYALKHSEPETYNALKSKLIDMMTDLLGQDNEFKMFLTGIEQMTLNNCLTEDRHKKVVKGSLIELLPQALKCVKGDKDSKHSVIRQGDGWTNNIMFKMNNVVVSVNKCEPFRNIQQETSRPSTSENVMTMEMFTPTKEMSGSSSLKDNDIPEECTLIDYQLVFESSPVYDIMYMLFNSTDHEQRLKHYHEFIDYYHSELDKSLNNFGLKANYYYPRDQLDADLKRYAKYAFANSVMVSNFIIKKPEEAELAMRTMEEFGSKENGHIDAIPSELFEQDPETFVLYKKKIQDLVDSFLEFGLLGK